MFTYQGRDPIKIPNPTEVTNETASQDNDSREIGQAFHTVHYLLYVFVIVHQTMSIQLSHCTKSKYDPWGRLITFLIAAMLIIQLISILRE